MEQLLLINPSKRPSKRRKPRSAAQKAATKRMLAANRSRRAPSAARTVKRRRKNKTEHVAAYYPNPRKRRSAARVARRVKRHSYRANPAPRSLMPMLKDAGIGAVGALAIDVMFGYIPLPLSLKTGKMNSVAKGAFAVLIGMFGGKILPRGMAGKMAAGSLTVTMHDALKATVSSMLPSAHLGYYPGGQVTGNFPAMNASPAPALSEYINPGMGEYVHPGMADIGNDLY